MADLPTIDVEFPRLWSAMSGIDLDRVVPTHSDDFKNQRFVVEAMALYIAFDKHPAYKGQLQNGAFFRCDDIEFFLMKYNESDEIMNHVHSLYKERLLSNVETVFVDPTLALLISAKEHCAGPTGGPLHELKIISYEKEGGMITLYEESTALPPK